MRIVLLNPPVPAGKFTNRDLMGGMGIDDGFGVGLGPRFVSLLKNEGTRLPVISLAFAAALLAEHDVTVLDQSRLDPHDPAALAAVAAARPEWVVAASSFAFLGAELRYLERVRAETGARRMLLNQSATFFADDILRRGLAEVIPRGDPEVAVGHLARGTLRPGLDGVMMADAGRPVPALNGFIDDLDTLPEPRWDDFPRDAYGYFPLLKRRPFLTMLSSRGCPYQCHFCPYPVAQGAPFRPRSAALVADEMERLVARFGVRSILFRDPTFSLDMKRVKELCRLVIERRLQVDWGIETRLDRMDEAMIELLGRAGCRSAEFGVDPIDEHTRQASHRRGIKPERAAELIRVMERNGIATAGLFVVGIPEQSEDEMLRTLDWVETLEVSYMNYEVATPFPGTELYAQAVRNGWSQPITLGDLLEGDPKLSFNGVIDLARMKALQDRALSNFYLRPRKVAREIFNQHFVENLRFMAASGLKFVRAELKA